LASKNLLHISQCYARFYVYESSDSPYLEWRGQSPRINASVQILPGRELHEVGISLGARVRGSSFCQSLCISTAIFTATSTIGTSCISTSAGASISIPDCFSCSSISKVRINSLIAKDHDFDTTDSRGFLTAILRKIWRGISTVQIVKSTNVTSCHVPLHNLHLSKFLSLGLLVLSNLIARIKSPVENISEYFGAPCIGSSVSEDAIDDKIGELCCKARVARRAKSAGTDLRYFTVEVEEVASQPTALRWGLVCWRDCCVIERGEK
jgi:hypothetical protein